MATLNKFENAVRILEAYDKKKKSHAEVKQCVNMIHDQASTCGLSQTQIISVIKLGTSGNFSASLSTILMHSLVPNESVPEEAALCGISRITSSKCPLKIQELVLEWIVAIFDLINSKSALSSIYGMLFNLLDYETLSPIVCHLLFLLTRQEDVTHFRIARLMFHVERAGSLPHINALMSVYRLHQPSLLTLSHGQKAHFKKTHKRWTPIMFGMSAPLRSSPRLQHKRRRTEIDRATCSVVVVPAAQPQVINDVSGGMQPFKMAFYQQVSNIQSFDDMIRSFGNLRMPRQAASMLSERKFQHIIAISPDSTVKVRLHFWLQEQIYSKYFDKTGDETQECELLKILLTQKELFKMDLGIRDSFLYPYLETWNGHSHSRTILKLISTLPALPFDVLHEKILKVISKLFLFEQNNKFRCRIINMLTDLCCNYIALEFQNKGDSQLFDALDGNEKLIKFTDNLLVIGLSLHPSDTCLLYSALEFWRSVTKMLCSTKSDMLLLPHFSIMYKGLFSCSSECVNSICSTILCLMQTCMDLRQKKMLRRRRTLEVFNTIIADFHDTLWRHRAFHPYCSDNSIAYNRLDFAVIKEICLGQDEMQITSAFSIDKHPGLIISSSLFCQINGIAPEKAMTSQLLFEPDYMKFLKREGLYDILKLLQEITDLG